jgi:hypothetical protein
MVFISLNRHLITTDVSVLAIGRIAYEGFRLYPKELCFLFPIEKAPNSFGSIANAELPIDTLQLMMNSAGTVPEGSRDFLVCLACERLGNDLSFTLGQPVPIASGEHSCAE